MVFREYSDKECAEMIRNMTYTQDAPDWVIKEIRKKRRKIERRIKSPEKEMDAAMKELGGSKRYGK